MNGRISLLGVLLGLQLIIVALVWFARAGAGDAAPETLLAFSPPAVDELRVSGADDAAAVIIRRAGDGWELPSGLPADAAKVAEVLEQLAGVEASWAVATSAGARERFEVTEENHQRHLVLSGAGETLADLYLGTSPGFQKVHARAADADSVFSVALSNYQFPTETDEWLDRTLLQPEGDVVAVERVGEWRLERGEPDWRLVDGDADSEAAAELVRRFAELRVSGTAPAPADGVEPTAEFRISDRAGDYILTLYGAADDESYAVRSSRREGAVFGLAAHQAGRLLEDRAALVGAAAEPAGDGAASE
ncbi:MAG: DUF4340 domain-containing protein [Pseudomonadales bacterium]